MVKKPQSADHIHRDELAPLPEQYGDGEGGEHDIIDGRDLGGDWTISFEIRSYELIDGISTK